MPQTNAERQAGDLLLTNKIIIRTPMFGVDSGVSLLMVETPQGTFNVVHWTPRHDYRPLSSSSDT